MGKTITQQARGHGSLTYQIRPRAYRFRITYPDLNVAGKAKIIKLFNSPAHSTPLIKVHAEGNKIFICPAAEGVYEGQEIEICGKIANGNIARLESIPQGAKVFNIENSPGKGGVFLRSAGCSGIVMAKDNKFVEIIIQRRRLMLNKDCRATIGVAAGEGRLIKPLIKAGKQHHRMKAIGRKWHRTSAVKQNAIDHPFGGGRGKRIKSKIAKRNAPPGAKVGHISPRRTGHIR